MGEESVVWGGTEVSQVSQMSQVVSATETGDAPPSETSVVGALVVCLMCLLIAGVVAYLVLVSLYPAETDEGEGEGSGGGGPSSGGGPSGGGPSTGVGRAATSAVPLQPGTGVAVIVAPDDKSPPPEEKPVKQFVCTVGDSAVVPKMYPQDGLCDYLYYTHVVVLDEGITFTDIETSWEMFREQASSFSATGVGISFDARYVSASQLRNTTIVSQLNTLAAKNIKNYGLLNIIGQDKQLNFLVTEAKTVIEEFKNIQAGDDALKTIVAMGLHDYSKQSSWNMYMTLLKEVVENTKADTVIVISSTNMIESEHDCIAVPPLVKTSAYTKYPTLEKLAPLASNTFAFSRRDAVVGLSMEMAVLTYMLKDKVDNPDEIAYRICAHAGRASADLICSADTSRSKVVSSSTLAGFGEDAGNHFVFLAESLATIDEKVEYLKTVKLRSRFAWLLYDVHLTDLEGQCMAELHARVAHLKNKF